MIKEFRKRYNLTQRKLGELSELKERTIRYFESLERNRKLKDTPKVLKLKIFMVRYEVEHRKEILPRYEVKEEVSNAEIEIFSASRILFKIAIILIIASILVLFW